MKQYDVAYVDFPKNDESVQAGLRPALIFSNNLCNQYSPVITAIPVTSARKKHLPTHLYLPASKKYGLNTDSVLLAEQITTVNKRRVQGIVGNIDSAILRDKIVETVDVQFARDNRIIDLLSYLESIGVRSIPEAKQILMAGAAS